MQHERRLLALDIGAESGRGVVGRFDGQRMALDEVHRFPNVPVHLGNTLYWDFLRLFGDIRASIARAGSIASLGVDTWGVDFGLLDKRGRLLANPVHYRDKRTAGLLDRIPRQATYTQTGIQFLEINTLVQLRSMVEQRDPDLERAEQLLLIPDLVHHFLCGNEASEYTNATTTQCFDPRQGTWVYQLLDSLAIPTRLFPEVVQPGTRLGAYNGATVVAPATHDTASAVASMPLDEHTLFVSSGTWTLVGVELPAPVINDQALQANLTNEGGVNGTTRLLKNVMGLWLVQQARNALAPDVSYADLTHMARRAPAFTAFVDPDDVRFLRATAAELPRAVEQFCIQTRQHPPQDIGTLVRVLLESLALKYAAVLDELAAVTNRQFSRVYIVGGGVQNSLLCELTAGATGLPVTAGSAEATAIGNLMVQALALGELRTLREGRELVAASFATRCYEPEGEPEADWSAARQRFQAILAAAAVEPAGPS
ncbi:MAG: rhamnulokinase [Chloroflexi bacterium]|nr:rhamnulokinase [Chloroflexota bacterium]MBV9545553.1 rhamnulokinase [Chloroflexota bacterium]